MILGGLSYNVFNNPVSQFWCLKNITCAKKKVLSLRPQK